MSLIDGAHVSQILNGLVSLPIGLLTIFMVVLVLVAGWWRWSGGKGVGPWMWRGAAILLTIVGAGGAVSAYQAAAMQQETDAIGKVELMKEMTNLRRDLTTALGANRVQEAKLAALERTASEQKQLDAERAAELEADLKKAMDDIGAMFSERNGIIELVLKDAVVHFDTDLSTLQCGSKERLSRVVGAISRVLDGIDSITIVGHTDFRGTADHNKQLSKQRADAVVHYLAESGIPRKRMSGIGKSYLQPAAFDDEQSMAVIRKANATDKDMSENRRVQLLIKRKAIATGTK